MRFKRKNSKRKYGSKDIKKTKRGIVIREILFKEQVRIRIGRQMRFETVRNLAVSNIDNYSSQEEVVKAYNHESSDD
jgi:hypothetical protein